MKLITIIQQGFMVNLNIIALRKLVIEQIVLEASKTVYANVTTLPINSLC